MVLGVNLKIKVDSSQKGHFFQKSQVGGVYKTSARHKIRSFYKKPNFVCQKRRARLRFIYKTILFNSLAMENKVR